MNFWTFVLKVKNKWTGRPNPPMMAENPDYGRFSIGKWSYGTPKILSWGEGSTLSIGKYCSIAPDVVILLGGEHRLDWVSTYPFSTFWKDVPKIPGHPRSKGNVVIGNDVWIGEGALILSGVQVGSGAVIGARCVVTQDIPPYAIAAGNPARIIRYRFPPDQIEALLRICWWDWPEEKIKAGIHLFLDGDIQKFLDHYDIP